MARRSVLIAMLVVAGCTSHAPAPVIRVVTSKPIVEMRTVVVVKIVHAKLNQSLLKCPDDPPLPYPPSQKTIGIYMANLRNAADTCRANLEVLGK